MLTINNIEVVYDNVILVLKGVSLEARAGAADQAGVDRERAAVGHRLHRVEHQVDQHLLHPIRIAGDGR